MAMAPSNVVNPTKPPRKNAKPAVIQKSEKKIEKPKKSPNIFERLKKLTGGSSSIKGGKGKVNKKG
ncbi:hypothetical protein ACKUB1_02930 [Methanospirillum stamsii]|uniref:Uncharacterized protein n=1 Tax=Methanospirillum stamsii TaxID=1277351 RepID=A0A2V2N118_9EURY|nr:hypothetical protein [Methanospirillum stamsii]PWR69867.1 hypothetical protein DLD82_16775 [Methanospirillum stamsii]